MMDNALEALWITPVGYSRGSLNDQGFFKGIWKSREHEFGQAWPLLVRGDSPTRPFLDCWGLYSSVILWTILCLVRFLLVHFDVFFPPSSGFACRIGFSCVSHPLLHLPLEEIQWPGVRLCAPQLAFSSLSPESEVLLTTQELTYCNIVSTHFSWPGQESGGPSKFHTRTHTHAHTLLWFPSFPSLLLHCLCTICE